MILQPSIIPCPAQPFLFQTEMFIKFILQFLPFMFLVGQKESHLKTPQVLPSRILKQAGFCVGQQESAAGVSSPGYIYCSAISDLQCDSDSRIQYIENFEGCIVSNNRIWIKCKRSDLSHFVQYIAVQCIKTWDLSEIHSFVFFSFIVKRQLIAVYKQVERLQ